MSQCWRDYLDMFLWFYFFEWMLSIGRKASIPFYGILSQVLRGLTIGIPINLLIHIIPGNKDSYPMRVQSHQHNNSCTFTKDIEELTGLESVEDSVSTKLLRRWSLRIAWMGRWINSDST